LPTGHRTTVVWFLFNTTPSTLLKEELRASTVISLRLTQPKKVEFQILVTLAGIATLVKLAQSRKTESPIVAIPLEIVTLVKLEHSENAEFPRLVTLAGLVTLVRLEQS
jgi:hypothetical protein